MERGRSTGSRSTLSFEVLLPDGNTVVADVPGRFTLDQLKGYDGAPPTLDIEFAKLSSLFASSQGAISLKLMERPPPEPTASHQSHSSNKRISLGHPMSFDPRSFPKKYGTMRESSKPAPSEALMGLKDISESLQRSETSLSSIDRPSSAPTPRRNTLRGHYGSDSDNISPERFKRSSSLKRQQLPSYYSSDEPVPDLPSFAPGFTGPSTAATNRHRTPAEVLDTRDRSNSNSKTSTVSSSSSPSSFTAANSSKDSKDSQDSHGDVRRSVTHEELDEQRQTHIREISRIFEDLDKVSPHSGSGRTSQAARVSSGSSDHSGRDHHLSNNPNNSSSPSRSQPSPHTGLVSTTRRLSQSVYAQDPLRRKSLSEDSAVSLMHNILKEEEELKQEHNRKELVVPFSNRHRENHNLNVNDKNKNNNDHVALSDRSSVRTTQQEAPSQLKEVNQMIEQLQMELKPESRRPTAASSAYGNHPSSRSTFPSLPLSSSSSSSYSSSSSSSSSAAAAFSHPVLVAEAPVGTDSTSENKQDLSVEDLERFSQEMIALAAERVPGYISGNSIHQQHVSKAGLASASSRSIPSGHSNTSSNHETSTLHSHPRHQHSSTSGNAHGGDNSISASGNHSGSTTRPHIDRPPSISLSGASSSDNVPISATNHHSSSSSSSSSSLSNLITTAPLAGGSAPSVSSGNAFEGSSSSADVGVATLARTASTASKADSTRARSKSFSSIRGRDSSERMSQDDSREVDMWLQDAMKSQSTSNITSRGGPESSRPMDNIPSSGASPGDGRSDYASESMRILSADDVRNEPNQILHTDNNTGSLRKVKTSELDHKQMQASMRDQDRAIVSPATPGSLRKNGNRTLSSGNMAAMSPPRSESPSRNPLSLRRKSKSGASPLGMAAGSTDIIYHSSLEDIEERCQQIEQILSSYVPEINWQSKAVKPTPGWYPEVPRILVGTSGASSYASYPKENLDLCGFKWYEDEFYLRDHQNFVGMSDAAGPVIISVKREGKGAATVYKALIRTQEVDEYTTISASLVSTAPLRMRPSVKELLRALCPRLVSSDLNFKDMPSPPSMELQKELLKIESNLSIKSYKFGIVYAKDGKMTDNDMFGNEHGSPAFNHFLTFLGEKIQLKGWKKYRGGLDAQNNTTGEYSIYTQYRDVEIMFHVTTLLPFSQTNPQQLERKRHVGNDIGLLIWRENCENTPYDPTCMPSEYNHFIVIIDADTTDPKAPKCKVSIIAKDGVPFFGPPTPSSPFGLTAEFREFLLTKLINGENASYLAPAFSTKMRRTKYALLKNIIDTFRR